MFDRMERWLDLELTRETAEASPMPLAAGAPP